MCSVEGRVTGRGKREGKREQTNVVGERRGGGGGGGMCIRQGGGTCSKGEKRKEREGDNWKGGRKETGVGMMIEKGN